MQTTIDPITILSLQCGAAVITGEGISLIVNSRTWPIGTAVDADVPAIEATLTQDGRRANTGVWHRGVDPEPDSWVYVERWTRQGREFHGWIDASSRNVLQAG